MEEGGRRFWPKTHFSCITTTVEDDVISSTPTTHHNYSSTSHEFGSGFHVSLTNTSLTERRQGLELALAPELLAQIEHDQPHHLYHHQPLTLYSVFSLSLTYPHSFAVAFRPFIRRKCAPFQTLSSSWFLEPCLSLTSPQSAEHSLPVQPLQFFLSSCFICTHTSTSFFLPWCIYTLPLCSLFPVVHIFRTYPLSLKLSSCFPVCFLLFCRNRYAHYTVVLDHQIDSLTTQIFVCFSLRASCPTLAVNGLIFHFYCHLSTRNLFAWTSV